METQVENILKLARKTSGGTLSYKPKPKIKLHGGGTRVPDFQLVIKLPHEKRHFLIECQNRQRSSNDIVDKIRNIRTKHKAKTFVFVYPKSISAGLTKELEREGITHLNLIQFETYINDSVVSAKAGLNALSPNFFWLPNKEQRKMVSLNSDLDPVSTERILKELEASKPDTVWPADSRFRTTFG